MLAHPQWWFLGATGRFKQPSYKAQGYLYLRSWLRDKVPASSEMGVSKNNGKTPKSSHFSRVFHYFHHPFWGKKTLFLVQHPNVAAKVGLFFRKSSANPMENHLSSKFATR